MKKLNGHPEPGPLRVLILEDSPADAELIERQLRRAKIDFTSCLVEGKSGFSKALDEFKPQVILSDFKLPKFDGLAALEAACLKAPDTPFLFVSGSIGEEMAIETLAQGASDYIFKDNLARLGPAVKRVVAEARLRQEKKIADEELRRHADELRLLVEAADHFVHINELDKIYAYLTQTIRSISGADYLLLSMYNEERQGLQPKVLDGVAPFQELLIRQLGRAPEETILLIKDMSPAEFADFLSRKLLPSRDGLFTLTDRTHPRSVCRLIEKAMGITAVYSMGFSWENQLFGGLALAFKKGKELRNSPTIEAMVNLAAVAIKRLLAEKSLRESKDHLLQSEEYYRTLVETSPDAIVIVDAGGRLTFASAKTHVVFGVPGNASIVGTSIMDFVEPGEVPRVRGRLVEILSGRSFPEIREYRLLRHDRRPFWGEISSAALHDSAGRNVGLLLILRDVSNRKRAEEQIQYQADLLQNVSDAIIATDQEGRIQVWNKAAERIYGWSAQDAIGKNFHDMIQPEYRYQGREEVIAKLDREGAWSGEIVHNLRDGRQIPVQSTITNIKDTAGNPAGTVSVNHDISERMRAEELLRERDQLLKNLSAQVPGMIFTFQRRPDGTYRIPYSSDAILGIFGVAPGDVIHDATAIFKAILAEDQPRVVAAIENSARMLTPWQAEYRVQLPGQPIRWMLGQSDPIRLADGSTLWYGFNTDISERKRVEEQIRSSLREKEVLLQEVHHRVKNNLQIISGLLTLQVDQSAGKSLEEVFHESQDRIHTIALIHEKLYRSHNLAEIAFDDYLRALTENLFSSHGIAAGRVTAGYDMEKILLTIEKAIPLGLIVNELVTNSLKHAFPDGRRGEIRVRLRGYGEAKSFALKTDSGTLHIVPTCELVVADDGVGLPPGFSLAQQKTLGMNLVSMLAQQLQAELKVKPGPGAEFRLLFPGLPTGSKTQDERQAGGS